MPILSKQNNKIAQLQRIVLCVSVPSWIIIYPSRPYRPISRPSPAGIFRLFFDNSSSANLDIHIPLFQHRMSKKDKKEEEELPEPKVVTDADFDDFINACNTDEGWEVCFDKDGILFLVRPACNIIY